MEEKTSRHRTGTCSECSKPISAYSRLCWTCYSRATKAMGKPTRDALIEQRHREGLTARKIGEEFGISYQRVLQILKAKG
jgi:predicted amidophosphoribosyltransferase